MTSVSPIAASLYVFVGGGAGAILRYQAGRLLTHLLGPQAVTAFPWATLAVNVIGGCAMGLLAGWLARHGGGSVAFVFLAAVGAAALLAGLLLLVGRMEVGGSVAAAFV